VHEDVLASARQADRLVGDSRDDGQQHDAAHDAQPEIGPAEEGEDENGDEHDDQEERRAAARMEALELLCILRRQWKPCLEAEDRLVLCAVVLEDALNVLHARNAPDVGEKDKEAQEALGKVQKDGIVRPRMEELGRSRKTNKLMSEIVAYNEVWFTDETADYGEQECVAWYFGDLVLDKIKNPNFLYDKEGLAIKNFIDAPTKPYVFFNYLNDGSSLIDQTSPIEQAIPLQDVLNKRGRQIIENADTANSILVLKSGAIKSEDAANITRDPNQILMLDAPDEQPINSAFGEVTPHLLPSYVIEDYQNTKNAIHNVLGTPSQFRGDDSKREVGTLGEAKMIQGQAGGRQDEMVRELEDGLDRYFRLLVQMMKVYYDEPKRLATRDNNGKFVSVQLSRATMPNIANISISHGSLLRVDRERQENISMNLAKMGLIDPYNLYKDLSLKDADKRYETLNKFRIDPSSLVSDISSEINDRDAYIDFSVFMNGEEAEPRKNIKPSYIEAATKLMSTDEFLYADPKKRQKWIEFIGNMVINLAQRAKVEEASQQGVLVDPNIPMEAKMPDQLDMLLQQEQPPQMPPGMMPEEAMPPVDAGQMPPMPEMGQGMPVQDVQQPQDASVLTGLLGV